jgi:hypothetical protein
MSYERFLENLVLAVASRVAESMVMVAGQVVKGYGYDPGKVDKLCENMIARAKGMAFNLLSDSLQSPVPVGQGEGGKWAGVVAEK